MVYWVVTNWCKLCCILTLEDILNLLLYDNGIICHSVLKHISLVHCTYLWNIFQASKINFMSPCMQPCTWNILCLIHVVKYNIIVFFVFCFFKGGTILGSPDEVLDLGDTEITQDVFMDFLSGIEQQNFRSAI